MMEPSNSDDEIAALKVYMASISRPTRICLIDEISKHSEVENKPRANVPLWKRVIIKNLFVKNLLRIAQEIDDEEECGEDD